MSKRKNAGHGRNKRKNPDRSHGKTTRSTGSSNSRRRRAVFLPYILPSLVAIGVAIVGASSAYQSSTKANDIAEQAQINSKYQGAVQQLGDANSVGIRVGAIYSMQSIANESVAMRPKIISILAGFVREQSPLAKCATRSGELAWDVATALTVIGNENSWSVDSTDYAANLSQTCLVGAELSGLNFSGMNLIHSNLTGIDLTGTNLMDANMLSANIEAASASRADFTCSVLSNLDARTAWFINANFTGADLIRANMANTQLIGANFASTAQDDLDVSGADLGGATIPKSSLMYCPRTAQYQLALMR